MTTDRFSFRVPKGAFAMRKHVAEAIHADTVPGVTSVVADPQTPDVVYVTANKAGRIEVQARAAAHRGVDHTGAMRDFVHKKIDTPPTCPDCGQPHWAYQLCEIPSTTPESQ